ncbi:MAG: hypothetical protein RLZZ324_455 [Candidatus Parcubacteria bacterium]|jgi:hypothetical protein
MTVMWIVTKLFLTYGLIAGTCAVVVWWWRKTLLEKPWTAEPLGDVESIVYFPPVELSSWVFRYGILTSACKDFTEIRLRDGRRYAVDGPLEAPLPPGTRVLVLRHPLLGCTVDAVWRPGEAQKTASAEAGTDH